MHGDASPEGGKQDKAAAAERTSDGHQIHRSPGLSIRMSLGSEVRDDVTGHTVEPCHDKTTEMTNPPSHVRCVHLSV